MIKMIKTYHDHNLDEKNDNNNINYNKKDNKNDTNVDSHHSFLLLGGRFSKS